MKELLKSSSALVAVAFLLQPMIAAAKGPIVTEQPNLLQPVKGNAISPEQDPPLSNSEMADLVRKKIKYVFVIFNENNSFDHEYGTFPGVNGLYFDGAKPRSAADTPGFTQTYKDVNGGMHQVQPFRVGPQQNATFMDSTDHSHTGLAAKLDVSATTGVPQMDGFSQDEYNAHAFVNGAPGSTSAQAKGSQYANLVMAHVDCDTIPFFWQWANRFTIFDNIFATEDTPSSPNAIAMIAGQSGESQWVEHPTESFETTQTEPILFNGTINGETYAASGSSNPEGVPAVNDGQPWRGSAFDPTTRNRQPTSTSENWTPTNTDLNLTFANVLLTLAGNKVKSVMSGDQNAAVDQADIARDIPYVEKKTTGSFSWHWYQNGYDTEPNETGAAAAGHANYVSHHNGAQYFGYISNNSKEQPNLKGENDFFTDIGAKNLSSDGGVFYIRGGYNNILNQKPPIQNPDYPDTMGLTPMEIATIDAAKAGDDDHPSYSDKQLSEAMNARVINAIAHSKYWDESAIILTYDESDGGYDHEPPEILSYGPDKLPLARGVRIPLLLISPYARAGAVSHAEGDHNAIIETINAIFGLPPLSTLPDEAAALKAGDSSAFNDFGPAGFRQRYLGPRDTNSAITDSLLSGFSPARLNGTAKPLPASYAAIPDDVVEKFPHFNGNGCAAIHLTPTDSKHQNSIPAGFNTLPGTLPAYNVIIP